MTPPSGAQYEVTSGNQCVVVTEVGGGLRSYHHGSRAVLDGYSASEMCSGGRGQLLLPWPNRIRDGQYAFAAADFQLALTEPKLGNAIHGLVRWSTWQPADQSPGRLTMKHRLYPSPGYPFTLECEIHYHLESGGLAVRTVIRNIGGEPCPVGIGWHPYLRLDTPTIDPLLLTVPARTLLTLDQQQIPAGRVDVTDSPWDFRVGRAIGEAVLDAPYTDLVREGDGRARVRLENPADGTAISLWMDDAFTHAMIFSGDTVHPESRRRQGLAIEPMTCPPNAFASGEGLRTLASGETFAAEWGITPATPA